MKKRLKRLAVCLMSTSLAASMTVPLSVAYAADAGSDGAVKYADGTYEGTMPGYDNGNVTVAVTIEGGKITRTEVTSMERQTQPYWGMAQDLLAQITEKQTADLDAVSEATMSSDAILGAAKAALQKAAGVAEASEPKASWFAGGDGSKDSPFLIATADQLRTFATSLNGDISYKGYYVLLSDDIDISGTNWTPVGDSTYTFRGTFDGAGHTISGMTLGTQSQSLTIDSGYREIGFFGILGQDSVVKNLNLTNVTANVVSDGQIQLGGIAGATEYPDGNGAQIDNVSVKGDLAATVNGEENVRVGGVIGYAYRSEVINSDTDVNITSSTKGSYDQTGGIIGTSNTALVANSYALGDIDSKTETNSLLGGIVGYNMGDIVNVYADTNITAADDGTEAGVFSGEVDEGRVYNGWYNKADTLKIKDAAAKELPDNGFVNTTKIMNYAGTYYTGNLTLHLQAADPAEAAAGLNASFASFPVNLSDYGIDDKSLSTWASADGSLSLTDRPAAVTYARPEQENVPQRHLAMQDGTFYGRDDAKTTVVQITTQNDAVTNTRVVSGSSSGSAYEEALAKAKEKAIYNDRTSYEAADTSVFAGGDGTQQNPYQIANEKQLRYVAEAINEDVSWDGVYFKLTKDIKLSDQEWLPIGYMIQGYYRSRWTEYKSYPFKGNFDGANHTVTGLRIGTDSEATTDPRMQSTAGFFGYTRGGVTYNYSIATAQSMDPNQKQLEIENVNLKDVDINTGFASSNYAGGLIGMAQNGLILDNCSVEGKITDAGESGTLDIGGAIGYGLRGILVTDTRADVDIAAHMENSSNGNIYAGGFYGYDNRASVFNSYALGDVSISAPENRAYVGGFVGANGGQHFNTYAYGNVLSANKTSRLGGYAGNNFGISADFNSYYNSDAVQTVAGSVQENKAYGNGITEGRNTFTGKTAAELGSSQFADELNANLSNVAATREQMVAAIGDDPIVSVYYLGDGSDLEKWVPLGKNVGFAREADAYYKTLYTPAKVTGVKSKAGKKQVKVSWKKVKKATGYQVVRAASKNGKYTKVKTTKSNAAVIKKLKKGKKYYFKVRAYRKVNGKTYYGAYSKVSASGKVK